MRRILTRIAYQIDNMPNFNDSARDDILQDLNTGAFQQRRLTQGAQLREMERLRLSYDD